MVSSQRGTHSPLAQARGRRPTDEQTTCEGLAQPTRERRPDSAAPQETPPQADHKHTKPPPSRSPRRRLQGEHDTRASSPPGQGPRVFTRAQEKEGRKEALPHRRLQGEARRQRRRRRRGRPAAKDFSQQSPQPRPPRDGPGSVLDVTADFRSGSGSQRGNSHREPLPPPPSPPARPRRVTSSTSGAPRRQGRRRNPTRDRRRRRPSPPRTGRSSEILAATFTGGRAGFPGVLLGWRRGREGEEGGGGAPEP